MQPVRAQVIAAAELGECEIAAWSAMQAAQPAFATPLLSPHFARMVGEIRDDARVAIYSRGGATVGFFAHHRRPSGFARPIGAPLSDYHGLITVPAPEMDGADALGAAGLAAFRFSGLIDPLAVFGPGAGTDRLSYRIVLRHGAAAHLDDLARASRNRARNFRRYSERLARHVGPLRLEPFVEAQHLETLFAWKHAQIAATGVQDFLTRPARALLWRLFETREGPLQGLALGLFAGERLAAAHFGARAGDYFHPWIGAADPDLEFCSAGFVHQWLSIQAMDRLDLRTYDLGPGFDHWKAGFASETLPVASGLALAAGAAGRGARRREELWRLPVLAAGPAAERLRRRLDQIAQTELTLPGRIGGVLSALAHLDRRLADRTARRAA